MEPGHQAALARRLLKLAAYRGNRSAWRMLADNSEAVAALRLHCGRVVAAAGDRAEAALDAIDVLSLGAKSPDEIITAFAHMAIEIARQAAMSTAVDDGEDLF